MIQLWPKANKDVLSQFFVYIDDSIQSLRWGVKHVKINLWKPKTWSYEDMQKLNIFMRSKSGNCETFDFLDSRFFVTMGNLKIQRPFGGLVVANKAITKEKWIFDVIDF